MNKTPEEITITVDTAKLLGGNEKPREPKLYYFNPNTYGTEWFVAAYSRGEAIAAVEAHIRKESVEDDLSWAGFSNPEAQCAENLRENLELLKCYVEKRKNGRFASPPCIEEHPIGKVIQTEIS